MMKQPAKPAEQLLKDFCKAYHDRDLTKLLSLFTKNTNMWGTGIDEYRVGIKEVEKQLKRDWSQSDTGEIKIESFVPAPENALWCAAICTGRITLHGQEHVFEHLRGTIIIEKEDGVWKISHMHASFPDVRNAENNSFPLLNDLVM